MEIPILVEPVSNNGFRATSGSPLALEIEAPTREEAINKLRELIDRRIAAGAEVVGVEIGGSKHPLAPFAGMLKDDPLLRPWKDAIADFRAQTDSSDTQ